LVAPEQLAAFAAGLVRVSRLPTSQDPFSD
jgi:hypothetical protein